MEILYEEEGKGYVGLSWEESLKVWMIHIKTSDMFPKEWSLSAAKHYLKVRDLLREEMKKRGIKEVYGLAETPKEVKYDLLIGAEVLPYIVYDTEGNPNYLVKGVV